MSNFWHERNILITGAGGFTGFNLAVQLEKEGANVRAFLRRGGSKRTYPDSVKLFVGDLVNFSDCQRACEGVDTVFHVAAIFRQVKVNREELEAVHVHATENLIRAAHQANCRRFVHTSTMGVHGHVKNGPADEQSPFSPGDDYQETKLEGELTALHLGDKLGLPVTVIRPCGIYGPGDARFLKIIKPIAHGCFYMLGSGKTHYHFVYINDLVQGFMLAGEKDTAVGESFLIGDNQSLTLNRLVSIIASILDVKVPRMHIPVWPVLGVGWACEGVCKLINIEPPLHPRRVSFFIKNRQFRIDKAKRLLGFEPAVSVSEGFKHTIDWYRENNLL